MPTTATNTYSVDELVPYANPDDAMESMTNEKFAPSLTLAKGTVVGKITASGLYKAYASGNADGSQIPVGLTRYRVVTDASSNITNLAEYGITPTTAPIFHEGEFLLADLTGLDDNAVAVLNGRLDGAAVASATRLWL
jgi:hypothetical protein